VRRSLFAPDRNAVGRAVMCDIPATEAGWSGLEENRYVFDFRAVPDGLKGYVWEFPCWIDGTAHVNLGAYALDRGDGGVNLGELVRDRARMLGQSSPRLEAFPIRWYDPRSPIGGLRALLVGDAAGCDPLMGEGISYAFEYARLAASEIRSAFSRGCFELGGYSAAVAHSWVGRKLRRLRFASRFFYGPTSRLGFAMAARSRRLQDVGIRWYNGVDGWDRQSGWKVASRLVMGAS
jgi:flavin-dependent dehydrogenase